MKRVQYEKRGKQKKNATWNQCNMKKVQHVKGATRQNFNMGECNLKNVQHGNNAT